uniref:Dihydrofolate synthase / folylpolyglutamate synthase n=1 Tax=Tetraselmis sp. GSL018 TaxID=582737 RepID=A0A061R482_9CHLO
MDALGDTVFDIATVKAGITRPGRPVVLGPQLHSEAVEAVRLTRLLRLSHSSLPFPRWRFGLRRAGLPAGRQRTRGVGDPGGAIPLGRREPGAALPHPSRGPRGRGRRPRPPRVAPAGQRGLGGRRLPAARLSRLGHPGGSPAGRPRGHAPAGEV